MRQNLYDNFFVTNIVEKSKSKAIIRLILACDTIVAVVTTKDHKANCRTSCTSVRAGSNDPPISTEPCKGIHLTHRCETITLYCVHYISSLQILCQCAKISSTVNIVCRNSFASKECLCCLIIQ